MSYFFLIILLLTILLMVYLRKLIKSIPTKKDKIIVSLNVIVPWIICIMTFVFLVFHKPIPKDYVNINRPYLHPILKIIKTSTDEFYYYFMVTNTGKISAENLNFSLSFPDFCGSDGYVENPTEIAPGTSIETIRDKIQFSNTYPFINVALYITYDANILKKRKYYSSEFTYLFSYDQIEFGEFDSYNVRRSEGKLSYIDRMNKIQANDKLDNNVGTFTFWFKETLCEELAILQDSKYMQISYNPDNRVITFIRIIDNQNVNLNYILSGSKNEFHFYAITWNNGKINLYFDGKHVADIDFYEIKDSIENQ